MKKIKILIEKHFLNPRNDDISDILSLVQDAHTENLNITDFNKSTLAISDDENKNSVYGFSIPNEGVICPAPLKGDFTH